MSASIEVVNAAFLIGNLALRTINLLLEDKKNAENWFTNRSAKDFAGTLKRRYKLKCIFVVQDKQRAEVAGAIIKDCQHWITRYADQRDQMVCWLPVYHAIHLDEDLKRQCVRKVSEARGNIGALLSKPTADISPWPLIAAAWATGAMPEYSSHQSGAEQFQMHARTFHLRFWRLNLCEKWQGHISCRPFDAQTAFVDRPRWEMFLKVGHSLFKNDEDKLCFVNDTAFQNDSRDRQANNFIHDIFKNEKGGLAEAKIWIQLQDCWITLLSGLICGSDLLDTEVKALLATGKGKQIVTLKKASELNSIFLPDVFEHKCVGPFEVDDVECLCRDVRAILDRLEDPQIHRNMAKILNVERRVVELQKYSLRLRALANQAPTEAIRRTVRIIERSPAYALVTLRTFVIPLTLGALGEDEKVACA